MSEKEHSLKGCINIDIAFFSRVAKKRNHSFLSVFANKCKSNFYIVHFLACFLKNAYSFFFFANLLFALLSSYAKRLKNVKIDFGFLSKMLKEKCLRFLEIY